MQKYSPTKSVLLICILIAFVSSKTVYVSPFGSDFNSGNKSNPVQTIKNAVDIVNDGDDIFVLVGLYTGTSNYGITINKAITITGENNKRTILSCQGGSSSTAFVLSSDVQINNLNIQYCNTGVSVSKGSPSISNNIFIGNSYGVYTSSSPSPSRIPNLSILSNSFEGNTYSLYIRNIRALVVKDNIITESKSNTYLSSIPNLNYEKNLYYNNTQILLVERCNGIIQDVIFEKNVINPSLQTGTLKVDSGSIQITKAGFYDNSGKSSLYISNSATVSVTNSDFHDNVGGSAGAIFCYSGSGNIFETSFKRNTGTTAGAFYCSGSCQLFFDSCVMEGNTPDWSSTTCHL